ncbi:hypothetical protein O6H91_06G010300 [Diphasiastrum complanatum]|uniref:Uncharacterized protein n=1 Tax=Diphasiastrum complanatum TaxID=34168 RepID=A0ACC2DAV1_DIPCM|nr:hypothetical protein O6H91_06G010300 [Diphasiastrum complanatum]
MWQRNLILDKQQPLIPARQHLLEPGSAEFIAALAAGSKCRHIVHIGCGLSTIALATAARATGSCIYCVNSDRSKQEIVRQYCEDLGLTEFVNFSQEEPRRFIAHTDVVDFALFTDEPEFYIELFNLLKLKEGAIVVAYNALDESTNDYIRHVRQQPGVDSSTLPLGRGIEVTKIISWDQFTSRRLS